MGKELTMGSLFSGSGGFELAARYNGIRPVWNSEIKPFPMLVTAKNFPDTIQLGDITKIQGNQIQPVDIITFGSPCFPAGTLVLTTTGYKPIEKVVVDDYVLTHLGRWRRVTDVGSKTGKTIVLKGRHSGLECTPNHPIYTKNTKTEETEWVDAKDMLHRMWATPSFVEDLPFVTLDLESAMLEFFGFWFVHGSISGSNIVLPCPRKLLYVIRDTADLFFENITTKVSGDKAVIIIRDQEMATWMKHSFGKAPNERNAPGWLYHQCDLQAFLTNACRNGGTTRADRPNAYTLHFSSKKAVESFRIIAECCDYNTAVKKTSYQKQNGKQSFYYDITIIKRNTNHTIQPLHTWYKVRSIESTGRNRRVYNLTVEEDNSYIADGIVVHNCQDLSIAGNRAGLEGSRSVLFYEAIRIIKEMREATHGEYPRWLCWENVPGALSSNHGADFRAVLEAIAEINGEKNHIPMPGSKKWAGNGSIVGSNYSIAWRVLDAQWWGVPQRRRRVFLVGDFGSTDGAKEVLFNPQGLSWHFKESLQSWNRIRSGSEGCIGTSRVCFDGRGHPNGDVSNTVSGNHNSRTSDTSGIILESNDVASCLRSQHSMPKHNADFHGRLVVEASGFQGQNSNTAGGVTFQQDVAPTLSCTKHAMCMVGIGFDGYNSAITGDVSSTLGVNCGMSTGRNSVMTYSIQGSMIGRDDKNGPQGNGINKDVSFTLNTLDRHAVVYQKRVRRFTPLECCRLQGFPDDWCSDLAIENPTDDEVRYWTKVWEDYRLCTGAYKKPKTEKQIRKWLAHPDKDEPMYEMWGNGVALPCVDFVMTGIQWTASKNE